MATKLQTFSELADSCAKTMTNKRENWTTFLETAARLYKYSFPEQVMIFSQRANATGCESIETWNKDFNSFVQRGSKGIALIDDSGNDPILKYVFDASDARVGWHKNTLPYIWEMKEEHGKAVTEALAKNYGESNGSLEDYFLEIAGQLADDYYNDNKRDIKYSLEDSFLGDYDDFNTEVAFRQALVISTAYSLMSRCGLEPQDIFADEDWSCIFDFNTPTAVYALGTAVSSISEQVLRDIEAVVKNYEAERSKENGINIQSERRISDTELSNETAAGTAETGKIRTNEEELSEKTPPDTLQHTAAERTVVPTPNGNRGNSKAKIDGSNDGIGSTEQSGTENKAIGSESPSGGNNSSGADLQLNENDIVPISKTLENTVFKPEAVNMILSDGGNKRNSTLRIAAHYMKGKNISEAADFLKREFIQGGKGFVIDKQYYSVWYDKDGITIGDGKSAFADIHSVKLSWEQIALQIWELLNSGEYLPQSELSKAIDNEFSEIAERLWFFYRDVMHELPDEWNSTGGFPDDVKNITSIIRNPEKLAALADKLQKDVESLNRYPRWSDPKQLLNDVRDCQKQPFLYTSSMEKKRPDLRFITDDEVDTFFIERGSNVSENKYHTLEFFLGEHTTKEKADFLKKEFGTGGGTHALSGADNSYESHSAKGIEFSRGSIMNPYTKLSLNWNKAAAWVSKLIDTGKYMSQKELDNIPNYERGMIARSVINFFYDVPDKHKKPYNGGTEFHESKEIILAMLDDSQQVTELVEMMKPIYEVTPTEDRHYKTRQSAYQDILAYRDGSYNLFPKLSEKTIIENPIPENVVIPPAAKPPKRAKLRDIQVEGQISLFSTVSEQLDIIKQNEVEEVTDISITQGDIDAAITNWNGNVENKISVYEYMNEHARERQTAAFLKEHYGGNSDNFVVEKEGAEPVQLSWSKVQRRIAKLMDEGKFLTTEEKQKADKQLEDVWDNLVSKNENGLDLESVSEEKYIDTYEDYLKIKLIAGVENQIEPIVLLKVGDFYELFNDDAIKAVETLDIMKITRNNGMEDVVTCGFPSFNLDKNIELLTKKGYSVAVTDIDDSGIRIVKDIINADTTEQTTEKIETAAEPSKEFNNFDEIRQELNSRGFVVSDELIEAGISDYGSNGDFQDIADFIENEYLTEETVEQADPQFKIGDIIELENSKRYQVFDIDIDANNGEGETVLIAVDNGSKMLETVESINQSLNENKAIIIDDMLEAAEVINFDDVLKVTLERVKQDKYFIDNLMEAKTRRSLRNPVGWAVERSIRNHEQDELDIYNRYFFDYDFRNKLQDHVLKQTWANKETIISAEIEPQSIEAVLLGISDNNKAWLLEAVNENPRSYKTVKIVRELYGDTDFTIPQIIQKLAELVSDGRFEVQKVNTMPMYQSYLDIKSTLPENTLLMWRTGGGYEMYGEDAKVAAELARLNLVERDVGSEIVPMCSIHTENASIYAEIITTVLTKIDYSVAITDVDDFGKWSVTDTVPSVRQELGFTERDRILYNGEIREISYINSENDYHKNVVGLSDGSTIERVPKDDLRKTGYSVLNRVWGITNEAEAKERGLYYKNEVGKLAAYETIKEYAPTPTLDFEIADLKTARNDVLSALDSIFFTQNNRNGIITLLNENATNADISLYLSSTHSGMTILKSEPNNSVSAVTTSEGIENTLINRLIAWEEIAPVVRSLGMQWKAEQEVEQETVAINADKLISEDGADYYLFHVPENSEMLSALSIDNLSSITEQAERYVVCAEACYLSDEELTKYKIEFQKLPRDFGLLPEAVQEKITAINPKYAKEYEKSNDIFSLNGAVKLATLQKVADFVKSKLEAGEKFSSAELFAEATKAYGDTMSNNAFTSKDAYDAMEFGVNQYILSLDDVSLESIQKVLESLPPQTKRTSGMEKYQQFSTPPSIAYLANWTANVNENDIMLEPSVGIGGIAVFAKKDGAKVYVNELDKRRLEIVKNLPFDGFYNEDAEQINNIIGGKLEPTVIVMNPPFSSSANRNIQDTKIGSKHIEQALKMLAPNGRLVALVGQGMADDAPAFRSFWKEIKQEYNVKANIGIDGKNYNKYGTTFGIQMVVIDKDGATIEPTKTAFVENLLDLQNILGGIRNDRPSIQIENDNKIESKPTFTTHLEAADEGEPKHEQYSFVPDTSGRTDTGAVGTGYGKTNTPKADTAIGRNSDIESEASNGGDNGTAPNFNTERYRGNDGGNVGNNGTRQVGAFNSGQSIGSVEPIIKPKPIRTELTDSIFERYEPQGLLLDDVQPHPANISESAAMSAIQPPPVTYRPNLSQDIISKGILSDVQLEAVTYAGQSHSQTLQNGNARGFFLGDGTGVGKGRTITGVILDNYAKGRKKAVWLSENRGLIPDAKRDVSALFGNSDLVTEFQGGKKANSSLSVDEGILFVTYSALSKSYDQSDSNFEKIVNWLGKGFENPSDFDGVIVFDEAHNMANSITTKGSRGMKKASQRGMAGLAIQEALPNAKIVYSSATGATEVENLRYAERLGLWGEGTAFPNGDDFVNRIKSGGLAAMELIARDMKSMGVYLSRNISYEDVVYDKIVHELTPEQRMIYDELARSWQIVLQNITKALVATNQDKDGRAKGAAYSAFWGAQQRFFNQILTTMQIPSMITDIEKQLEADNSIVVQLVSTNEAAQEREFSRLQEQDLELEEFDLTPKQILMSYIENSFPTVQFEKYLDDNDNVRSKPVYDSEGNPVINREAVMQKEMLLDKLGSIKVPSSALDMIINHFGSDMVAENTGRKRRVIMKDGKAKEENITNKKEADVTAFQNGDKRIIVFSKAGGTGKSYHADKSAKNQQHRVHYLLQAGWQADAAVQGFGRSHRSNQASAPTFALVTTDLKGQMRFISTIAKRLDQLGALTKGQRQTGSQGLFNASDNLENAFAADVLSSFYKILVQNGVKGVSDGTAILEKLGLDDKLLDGYRRVNPNAPELREVNKFLNRILTLESSEQNAVFDGYAERLQEATERALENGTLDKGLENYRADKIVLKETHDIRVDEHTGAPTKYYNLIAHDKVEPLDFSQVNTDNSSFVGFYQHENTGAIRAAFQTNSFTDTKGNITSNYKLMGQDRDNEYMPQERFENNWKKLNEKKAEKLWGNAVNELPEFHKRDLHLIGGTVLPVWDKLPAENVRIYRVLTSDGELLIGRVIPGNVIDETLRKLGYEREKDKIETNDLLNGIKNGDTVILDNEWKITQRKVSNEQRIELIGASYLYNDLLTKKGVFTERIAYQTRFFIPVRKDTVKILDEIIKMSPVNRVENSKAHVAVKQKLSILDGIRTNVEALKNEAAPNKGKRESVML